MCCIWKSLNPYPLNILGHFRCHYLILALLACLLYYTARGVFFGKAVFLPGWVLFLVAVMVDISLRDEMLIFHQFSTCSWLVADGVLLSFPLSQVTRCLTLSVALQYLKYQIMLTNITDTIVPTAVIFIDNQ